jgi:cobaltochelatase CobS
MKKVFNLQDAFALNDPKTKDYMVEGLAQPTAYTPSIDPDYIFRMELIRDMFGFWVSGERAMLIIGHSGCGKTSIVEQWHSRLNLPLLTVVAHPRMEIADLVGHFVPTASGGMEFHYGPVARAAKEGLSVLIDEYFVLDPGVATGLNALLQGGMLYIPETGEAIRPAEGFRVFAATNPADIGAGYFGRNTQDAANQDRFYTIRVGYPKPEEETPLVQKVLMQQGVEDEAIAQMFAERMVDVANRVRKLYCGESDDAAAIDITLSTRSLKRWASLFTMFGEQDRAEHYALERAVTNRANPETAKAIHDVVDLVFGVAA